MPNTYIQRTPSGGNRKKWTWSAWIKLSDVTSGNRYLLSGYVGSSNTGYFASYFHSDSKLVIQGWTTDFLKTTRVFRDVSGWMHIVIVMDTAQATAANRLKIYINGVEETTFDTDNRSSISQDSDMGYNSNGVHTIGGYQSSGSANAGYNGLMSHVHFTDGYAYTHSDFGSTDSTTGEWKINTSPSVSYGTTGYWILKDGNGLTDQSPNSNNWTASGNLTKTEDNPSNVFATLNGLNANNQPTLTNGNNTLSVGSNTWKISPSTLAVSSGKWYVEHKITVNNGFVGIGIIDTDDYANDTSINYSGENANSVMVYSSTGQKWINNTNSSYGDSYTTNDIIGIAMDLDNNKIYFSKNGTFMNSGDPTSGATGTGAIDIPTGGSGEFFILPSIYNATVQCNFGNGYFGTTAVSSAGTNASGIGIFEYDVPSGYTALSTKGLNL